MSDREIKVVISATDDYSAQLNRFNTAIGGMDTAVGRAEASTAALSGAFNGLRMAWMQMGAIIAASAWFVSAVQKAGEAEEAYNKLRLQVEALGLSYEGQRQSIEGAINAASKYAIVQDEDVAAVLQQMIFHSGNYAASLENLNLVYDLAYLKNISAAEAATIVGKAITGNIEGLGRLFPELKDVNERLGEHATKAEKSAYSLQFFTEKVKGSRGEMTQYTRDVEEITAAYETLHQTIGQFIARDLARSIGGLQALWDEYFKVAYALNDAVNSVSYAVNDGRVVIRAATNDYKAGNDAIMESVFARGKSLTALEKETKAASDAAEAKKKAAELLEKARSDAAEAAKKAAEGTAAFKREMLRLDLEEEKIYEDMDARYAERRMKKLDADAKAAEAKRLIEREGTFTALGQLAESDRESPYKPQAGEGGQLGDAYAQYQGGDQLAALQDYNTQRMQLMVDAGKSQYEIEAEYERLTTEMKDREYQMRLGAGAQFAGGMANLFQNLYTASGKKNKALFEMAKAFAIAEAVMNTAKAATQALAFPPGPPISFVYVAAAIAAGAAQIATIASSKPGSSGGAISAGGYATPSYSGGSASAQPVPMRLEEDTKPAQHITFIINNPLSQQNWEKIAQDNIIPAINAAGDRNVKISLNAVEAN